MVFFSRCSKNKKKNYEVDEEREKSTNLPVDVLAAVSKCSTVFVKFGSFVVVVVDDAWAMTGFFVNCCDGGRFFLCTDGRITNILSPCGRWITVVVAELLRKRRNKKVSVREREQYTWQWILFILDWSPPPTCNVLLTY